MQKWFLLSKCPIHRLCLHGAILLVHQIYLLSISIKMHCFFLIRWIYIFFQLFVCRFRNPDLLSLRSFSLLHACVLFCLICICHTHHRIFYDFCLITVLYPIKNRIISIICNTDKIIRIQTFRLLCNRYRNYLKQKVKHCAYVQYCKCQHIPCSCL